MEKYQVYLIYAAINIVLILLLVFVLKRKRRVEKANMSMRDFYEGTGFIINKKFGALCGNDETKTWSVAHTIGKPQFYKYSDIKDYKLYSNAMHTDKPTDEPQITLKRFSSTFAGKIAYGDFSSYIQVDLFDGRKVYIPLIASINSKDRREITSAEVKLSKDTFELLKYMQENA